MNKTVIKEHLSCQKVEEFLMAYIDNELSLWTWLRFRFHLMICPSCTNYLEDYRKTIKLGKRLFEKQDAPAKGQVPDAILNAIINCK